MKDDEQLLCGWVYGFDHEAPDPGPRPWQTYAALEGGPLGRLLLDITGRRPEEADDDGAALPSRCCGQAAAPCTTRAPENPVRPARA